MCNTLKTFCDAGKILVDVSNNRRMNQYPESNAEYLASLLPDSIVVKGFNVISAWTLQQSCPNDTSTQVLSNIVHIYTFRHDIFAVCLMHYRIWMGQRQGPVEHQLKPIDSWKKIKEEIHI